MDFYGSAFASDGEHESKANQALETIAYVQAFNPEYTDLPIVTTGHSLGGKIAFYVASLTPEIGGVMALDPSNAGGGPCLIYPNDCRNTPVAPNNETGQEGIMQQMNQGNASSLIFRSKPDPLANPDAQFNADNFYFGADGMGLYAAPSPVWYYDMGPFPHGLYLPCLPSKQVQIAKRTMLAFLLQEVRGSTDLESYLTGDIIQTDIEQKRLVSVETR